MAYPYMEYYLTIKREQRTDICYNIDKAWKHAQ